MKKFSILLSLIFVIGLISAFALAEEEVTEPVTDEVAEPVVEEVELTPMEKADALYNEKTLKQVREAIAIYDSIMEGNEEATWKFARASYYIGVRTTDKGQQKDIFEKSYVALEAYIDAGSKDINTNYWYALCAGKFGKLKGILKSLFLVKPMKNACNVVIDQDPSYEDGAALTILGAIEYEIPTGSIDECIKYCTEALKYDPDGLTANLYLGKSYIKKDDYEKAKGHLEIAIGVKPKTPDDWDDHDEAVELLEDVNKELE